VQGSIGKRNNRHAKVYRNFRAEYDRLQQERIAAFREFGAEVKRGDYPDARHVVSIADAELEGFLKLLPPPIDGT
jgi:3-methyl-2-oxobutanoate hydroxymethyltransferase